MNNKTPSGATNTGRGLIKDTNGGKHGSNHKEDKL